MGRPLVFDNRINILTYFQTYEQWKEALPDTQFIKDLLPSSENIDAWRSSLIDFKDKIKDAVPDFELGNYYLNLLI